MLLWLSELPQTQVNSHQELLLYQAIAVDEQLQTLIGEICRHPVGSSERQKALNRFLLTVQKLPGIYHTSHQDYPSAWNRTLEWVCNSIDRFEVDAAGSVERSLVAWINGYLKWRIRDLYSPAQKYESSKVYLPCYDDEPSPTDPLENLPDPQCSLSLLEAQIAQMQEAQRQRQGEQIEDYILRDPQGKLSSCHPRQKPFCHCQMLAIRLLLKEPPDNIANISRELGINNQTLYSHWRQKCLPLLQEIGRHFGTEP